IHKGSSGLTPALRVSHALVAASNSFVSTSYCSRGVAGFDGSPAPTEDRRSRKAAGTMPIPRAPLDMIWPHGSWILDVPAKGVGIGGNCLSWLGMLRADGAYRADCSRIGPKLGPDIQPPGFAPGGTSSARRITRRLARQR